MGKAGKEMRVSVVIPAHNASGTLERTLASVRAQTVAVDEVIVVADRCSDATAEMARQAGCVVLEVDHGTPGASRNSGARVATGDIIFFLDSDDEWLPEKVERHLKIWQQGEVKSFVYDPARRVYNGDDERGVSGSGPEGPIPWNAKVRQSSWGCGSAPSVWREHYLAVGGSREDLRFAEDAEVLVLLAYHYGPGYRISDILTRYHQQANSLSRQVVDPAELRERFFERLPFATDVQRDDFERTAQIANLLVIPFEQLPRYLIAMPLTMLFTRITFRCIAIRLLRKIRPSGQEGAGFFLVSMMWSCWSHR